MNSVLIHPVTLTYIFTLQINFNRLSIMMINPLNRTSENNFQMGLKCICGVVLDDWHRFYWFKLVYTNYYCCTSMYSLSVITLTYLQIFTNCSNIFLKINYWLSIISA